MIKLLRNNYFIAFLFLLAYMATNPYIYGWDDQHLEIPILKHLIDPALYKGDYYVESAAKYFTSWLYPVLAKLITVQQVPAAYLFLFVVSRYFMFYFVYRLWLFISGSCFAAACATATFFLLGRTDEFLYRSFCHEEFSFIFMFAGLYCFYRERFLAAALLIGLGVNFHAIYNLFPMLYMLAYLLFCHPKRIKLIFQTGVVFTLASLPFLCWQIPISLSREVAHPAPVSEWMPLYLLACPQNFVFAGVPLKDVFGGMHGWWTNSAHYLILIGLYVFNFVLNPIFRRDKKVQTIVGLSWVLVAVAYYFDYIFPSRFVLDLNLIRVEQYLRFFVMGYTTLFACEQIRNSKPWLAFASAVLVLACGTPDLMAFLFLTLAALLYIIDRMFQPSLKKGGIIKGGIMAAAVVLLAFVLAKELRYSPQVPIYWMKYYFTLLVMTAVFLWTMFKGGNLWISRLLIIVPIVFSFFICINNCIEYWHLKNDGPGPWVLLRDWEDMQLYVRDHTPKDAVILTPYDTPMGGFRIHSERSVLVCYRDCGIIGFDYAAGLEWKRRINDIKEFKIYTGDPVNKVVLAAILKYRIDYVVFMRYYDPPEDNTILKKIYNNEVFSLFQVL